MSISVKVAGTEYAGAVDPTSVQATQMANDGEAGFGGFAIDDPGADVLTVGHKAVTIEDSECSQPRLFTGWTTQRDMGRSGERGMIVADDRLHDVTLVDLNAAVRFRILRGSDCKRPEESMDERMAWIIGKPALTQFVTNFDAVSSGYSRTMDEADYRGLTPGDVLDDILQREIVDLTYFVYWDPVAEEVALYFGPQTTATTESTLTISNVLTDIDGETCFAPDSKATLARKPDQVYSQVMLWYREGTRRVFRERESTATTYVDRGAKIDRPRVKKAATAQSQAERFLTAHAEEVDTITTTIVVPAASAGLAVAGQRIDVKFSHLPSYTDWTSMRIVQSTITPTTDVASHYAVTLELENPALGGEPEPGGGCPDPTPTDYYPPLGSGTSDATGNVVYIKPGYVLPLEPTPGYSGAWNFASYNYADGTVPAGFVDGASYDVVNSAHFIVVGPGIATIYTRTLTGIQAGSQQLFSLYGCNDGDIAWTLLEEYGAQTIGDDVVITVPADGYCFHEIEIEYTYEAGTPPGGGKIGFGGVDWVLGEVDTEEDLAEAPFAPVESTTDPTADDDIGEGYYVGQLWLNSTNSYTWLLIDNTEGAAVWTLITTGTPAWNFVTSDGVTTVDPTTQLTFVGATLADLGSAVAEVTFAFALDDLTDVTTGTPSDGDVLTWDGTGSAWVSEAPSAGSGAVATDTIWDAKGDLAVGTAANAAAALTVGTNGYVLTAASAEATGLKWAAQTAAIVFIIDGGGSAITTGIKGDLEIPFACTISAWRLLADQSGSIVVDVWKDGYANFPPTDADAMPGAGKEPTISSATKAEDTTVTDWTTDDIAAGDILRFNVDSVEAVTRATLTLTVTKT